MVRVLTFLCIIVERKLVAVTPGGMSFLSLVETVFQ